MIRKTNNNTKSLPLNEKVLTVCSCHVTYAFQSESTLYSCLNVKELLARSRREIWRLNDECISHISALCTRNLHAAQVGKHSTSSKNILLIALTMKLFSLFAFIKFFILFLFYFIFFENWWYLDIFFLIQKWLFF